MSGRSKILLLMLLGGAFCPTQVASQTASSSTGSTIGWTDFGYIKQSEAWLTSYNAAGLRSLPVDKISVARISAVKADGDFINYYQSDNSYTLGVQTESFYRLNSKVVFYGKIGYDYFKGKNMGGSVFINPSRSPFDIVEYSNENNGEKNKETYHLTGAVSADVCKGLTLGGKIDYTAANYAKFKDLRHKNKLLDMSLTAGASYTLNRMFDIGLNYYYRRSVEGVELKMYGTTDKQYYSLIGYGAFWGKQELFGETGYTKDGEEKPLFNVYNGGSLQLNVRLNSRLSFFNEFTYKLRDGHYGKRSSTSIVYSEHNSDMMEYRGVLSLRDRKNLHSIEINVSNEKMENSENIYRTESTPGGKSTIVYYDTRKVGDKDYYDVNIAYTGNFGVVDYNPAWVVKGGMNYHNRKQTLSSYPYYRKQNIHNSSYRLSGSRNLLKGKDMYTLSLGALYASGGGTAKNDGSYPTPTESQSAPKSLDSDLYREYEYLTCKQVKATAGFKYSRLMNKAISGYASVDCSLTKAFDVTVLGGDKFSEISLTIGCTF